MRQSTRVGLVLAAAVAAVLAGASGRAQTVVNPSGQKIVLAPPDVQKRVLNDKQTALADETDRLLSMATRLKEQVDMTSKNILSVKVVRTAEEIELYVHRLKTEEKR